jgi:tRNA pseudouridine32 synthase/23S rRNA pseudouridine746 synthase
MGQSMTRLDEIILFQDAQAIVIDKPSGLPVDAPRRGGDSIAARLHELKLGFSRPPVAMHRLDQDTSGCLLLARTPRARALIAASFEQGRVGKTYLALVADPQGDLGEGGTIDLPLAKVSSAEAGWRMVGAPDGKPAQTRWRRLARRDGVALIAMHPLTGRTHQLRVHAAEGLGRAILGDPVYSGARDGAVAGGMMLHAAGLSVPRPPYEPIVASAPLPARFGDWSGTWDGVVEVGTAAVDAA